ncbi:MAG: DUF5667 domain-containing protein [Anaerolineales bacterium]
MAKPSLDEVLDRCLTRLSEGSADVDRCLAENPDWASELRPLLEAAVESARDRPALEPDGEYARLSEGRLLDRIPLASTAAVRSRPARRSAVSGILVLRPVFIGALLVVALSLGSLGVARASASALPGDGLYAIKRGLEEVRLGLNLDPASDASLLAGYVDERLREIELLAAQGRTEDLLLGLEGYTAAVERLAAAVEVPSARGDDEVLDRLTRHIAVLEQVQTHVPDAVQEAIERVIERSIDAETKGRPSRDTTLDEECPGEPDCGHRQALDQRIRMANQIARIYNVAAEEALALFEGECAQDWKCVRTYFRAQRSGNPHRP